MTDLVQKTFERFPWKDLEVAHVLKVLSFSSWLVEKHFLSFEMSWKCLFSVIIFLDLVASDIAMSKTDKVMKCLETMSWVKVFTSVRAGHKTQLKLAVCNICFNILLKYVETNNILKYFLPQRELDIGLGCSWHVVVGEAFSFSVDFEQVLHCILTSSKSSNSFWSLRSLHFDFEQVLKQ